MLRVLTLQINFLSALEGISDPESKRKIIGKIFIDVFDSESQKVKDASG